ncbi:hypothetical protein THAOC_25827 [Thalassiosira oceanica]|uniref:Uncharacterized protein n=1 Tax=Thalassiosira oceanica TaxID=159749 RepID=K0RN13_THAOC|nr:hypothetical protein THAOC_25827 [Thalassiosira oceanica]|eukprot:EJK54535.1 hypothetical protein THAOC_25827 [Thalassiosira oceanica]
MEPFCDHCGQRRNAVGARRRQVFNSAASSRAVKVGLGNCATSGDTKTFQRYPSVHIQDVSATGHGHSAGRKRFESKTRRREPKRIPEPMANALSSRGPRGRERSDNSGDSLR